MYVTNEEWEQNNQDYLKESYEETGFLPPEDTLSANLSAAARSGVLHHHLHQEILSQLLVRQSGQQSAAAGIPPNAPSRFSLPVLRRKIHAPKRAGARYCSNACRQKDYRKRVTDAASAQNEHLVKRNASAK